MNTVLADKQTLMLPSEALNREFDLVTSAVAEQMAAAEQVQYLSTHGVLVGNMGLLLPQDEISELVEKSTVCRLPNTAAWFSGVTTVRGNMIPVFDLHELFSIKYEDVKRRMIVVGEAEAAVAFWVDDFPRLIDLTSDDSMTNVPPIPSLIRDHSSEYYLRDEQIWLDWKLDSFFTTLGEMLGN